MPPKLAPSARGARIGPRPRCGRIGRAAVIPTRPDGWRAQRDALRFVPAEGARERERTTAYHQRTMGGHLLSDVAVEEVRRKDRLVAIDDEALLVCPWASRSPFELRVVPRRPAPSFEDDGETGTEMIRTALGALAALFGSPPQLNLWVRTAPRGTDEFCWHVDL